MRRLSFLFVFFAFSAIFSFAQTSGAQGALFASGKTGALGECPLKNTKVTADITGFLARVTVVQEFENSFTEPIEAVYTFPLSQNGAVDAMTMRIGERTIRGRIMKREDARKVYEQAKTDGKTASLLDQQRPNIFTQSVANILPGEKILIEISYVETLKFEDGQYEFVFPMTIGPRYIPNSVTPADAQTITPKIAETRNGSDISIEVNLDAGVPTESVYSISHPISTANLNSNRAKIALRSDATIPNKDFILRYDVTGKRIEDALLTHRSEKGGFFSLILSPPDKFAVGDYTPKEIVFVLDTSGSMNGFPIEKAKEAMRLSLDGLNPQDTFNLITFAGDTHVLFDAPVPATPENLERAKTFLESKRSGGGTEMMKAIRAALEPTESQKHLRIVCFMTDGYVGNEAQIIAEIQKHPKARIFSFGIGNSVNRFLLDKMAQEGNGEVEYVSLKDDGSKAARRFFERVRTPVLTDISVEWNGLPVADVYPNRIGDLFSSKPVVVNGRYTKGAKGSIRLKGYVAGNLLVRDIAVNFPENEPAHDSLATLWARKRVDALMSDSYRNAKDEKAKSAIEEQITALGIEFRILTQFTSFVAVEEKIVNQNGKPVRVEVPVVAPEGTNGRLDSDSGEIASGTQFTSLMRITPNVRPEIRGSGFGNGLGNGSGSGNGNGNGSGNGDGDGLRRSDSSVIVNPGDTKNPRPEAVNPTNESTLSALLRRMEQHQKVLRTLRADVQMSRFNAQLNETDVFEGNMGYMTQPNSYALRLDWIKPNAELFSIIGDQFVLYRPALKTAFSGKTSVLMKEAFDIFANPSKEKLAEKFTVSLRGAEKLNETTPVWHLELVPKAAAGYKSVELWVDANGMILRVKVTENNGDWTEIRLINLLKNTQLSISDFRIQLPKDTKIVKN